MKTLDARTTNEPAVRDQLDLAIALVEYRWTLGIIRELANGPKRFTDLRAALDANNEGLRTALVRALRVGLVTRTRYKEFPIRVEYELTEKGDGLFPVVVALEEWANRWGAEPVQPHVHFLKDLETQRDGQ